MGNERSAIPHSGSDPTDMASYSVALLAINFKPLHYWACGHGPGMKSP